MNLVETRDGFDYYETKLLVGTETIHYHFELFSGKVHCYYNRFGIVKDLDEHYAFGIVPDLRLRTGQKVQSCTRFLWIVSVMETNQMTL